MVNRQNVGRLRLKRFWESGPLVLDTLKSRAIVEDKIVHLTEEQFDALYLLVQREGETMSFEDLYQSAWEIPDSGNCRRYAARQELKELTAKFSTTGKGVVQIEMLPEDRFCFRCG